jgi:putative two-component system response regulator
MKRWDAEHDGEIYRDIQAQANPTLSLYALESYAIIVDNLVQEELFRNLVLSHAEIARSLEETNQLLALSERRLREAQQIAHIGRWDIDHVHDTRSWSASYLEILTDGPRDETFPRAV